MNQSQDTVIQNESVVLDLSEWIAYTPRQYSNILGARWTSWPGLYNWEDAVDAGLIAGSAQTVNVSAQ